jgi:lysophospholipase L1-like esterase
MKLAPQSRLLMIGDSITEAGRSPEAWPGDRAASLGNGYAALTAALLEATYPAHRLVVTNCGVGGDTVRELGARWKRDVLELRPDWLTIMIGINDVWRQFDTPVPGYGVPPGEFEDTLESLVKATLPSLQGLVLLTPFYLEPGAGDPMRQRMDEYGGIVRRIAERNASHFVDTQAAFDRYLEHQHSYRLAGDRIHPNQVGHAIIARALLQALDYRW